MAFLMFGFLSKLGVEITVLFRGTLTVKNNRYFLGARLIMLLPQYGEHLRYYKYCLKSINQPS